MTRFHIKRVIEVLIVVIGCVVFGLLIHSKIPVRLIAFLALLIVSITIVRASRDQDLLVSFGISKIQKNKTLFLLASLLLGTGLAIISRSVYKMPLLPEQITAVALLAPLIGISEELVFRGFVQGHVKATGRIFSMIFATAGHTLYKVSVIVSLTAPVQFNIQFLIIWTFIGGMLFSLLKELSGSVLPPALAHACFDILLYGGFATIPFWVWA